jgi:hypothetical protein
MKKTIFTIFTCFLALGAMAQSKATSSSTNLLGNNLLSFSPVSVLDRGVGIGFSYERMLDKEQKIAFVLPVDLIFLDPNSYNYNSNESGKLFYTYVSPGIIFYPAGLRKVNYGVGPNLVVGYGNSEEWVYSTVHNSDVLNEYSNFRMGVMINQYMLMNITKNISMQINLGLGLRYINNYTYSSTNNLSNTNHPGMDIMGQFKLTFGYRF